MGLSLWEDSLMARLIPRYSKSEWERLTELIYPEERRHEFTPSPGALFELELARPFGRFQGIFDP